MKGLLLLILSGTAATGQEMRIPEMGPLAWDKVEGQSLADLWQRPDETSVIYM